jgi:hypothetical protein
MRCSECNGIVVDWSNLDDFLKTHSFSEGCYRNVPKIDVKHHRVSGLTVEEQKEIMEQLDRTELPDEPKFIKQRSD